LSNLKLGNWSESDPGVVGGLSYVVVGEGKYAIGLEDLATWTVVPVSGSPTLWDVIRGPDRFVILGTYLTIVIVDGQEPVETVDAEQYPIKGCYTGGWYWRVTNSADRVQKSLDGISWTDVTVDLDGYASLCIAAEGLVVLVTGNNGTLSISTDGGNAWTGYVPGFALALWAVGIHGGRAFAGSRESAANLGDTVYTADAPYTTWTPIPSGTPHNGEQTPVSAVFGGSVGILAWARIEFIKTTDNGDSWSAVAEPDAGVSWFRGIAWDGTRFVGATNLMELRTIDSTGTTVTTVHTFDFNLRSVAFGDIPYIPPTSGSGTHDLLVLPNGRAETTESLAQRVDVRLRTFIGEHWLNPELGVPWFEEFLQKSPDLAACRQILVTVLQDVPGVVQVDSLEVDFAKNSRQLRVSFAVSGTDSIPQQGTTAVNL